VGVQRGALKLELDEGLNVFCGAVPKESAIGGMNKGNARIEILARKFVFVPRLAALDLVLVIGSFNVETSDLVLLQLFERQCARFGPLISAVEDQR
jgi:hypothetical protein